MDRVRRRFPVAVIGGGPAGLAAAAALSAAGLAPVVLERGEGVGTSWRAHYDRLHLHTARWLSGLPGLPFPRRVGRWPARDDVVRYLEEYAAHHDLEVRSGVEVRRVDPDPGGRGWVLRSPQGDLEAGAVVVATGYNAVPRIPDWPGQGGFTGSVTHSRDYRSGAAYADRDVLVVGAGNSGAEIAVDLAESGARRVRLAVRRPPYLMPRSMLGVPTQLISVAMRYVPTPAADAIAEPVRRLAVPDLSASGWPRPVGGLFTRGRAGAIPILDVGLVAALRAGDVEPVAAVAGFDGREVALADSSRITPDAVVVATGYGRGLEPLVGHLGVLDGRGEPLVHGARTAPAAPRLHLIGFSNPMSGMFREFGIDAGRIARALSRGGAAAARGRLTTPATC
ncbi:flavin-containing monooxygenase [Pseudactinotalea terrae]|uniref:flavin-containing monooxygenase n=1 Tax=Pseudactinotalea terrae TaxID=1743262 RepID=UPI0019D4FE41|nr:NAD(P)/FAD-dependent oxidoreductase [Pseudactinotalea terrae]